MATSGLQTADDPVDTPLACKITFHEYIPGYEDTPSVIFTLGPGHFTKSESEGLSHLYCSELKISNVQDCLVAYKVRNVNEGKFFFLPNSIGVLSPKEETVITICAIPAETEEATLAQCRNEFFEILGCPVDITNYPEVRDQDNFWTSLIEYWASYGLPFPRMETQLFRAASPPERQPAKFLTSCIEAYTDQAVRYSETVTRFKDVRKTVGHCTVAGLVILVGAILAVVLRANSD